MFVIESVFVRVHNICGIVGIVCHICLVVVDVGGGVLSALLLAFMIIFVLTLVFLCCICWYFCWGYCCC